MSRFIRVSISPVSIALTRATCAAPPPRLRGSAAWTYSGGCAGQLTQTQSESLRRNPSHMAEGQLTQTPVIGGDDGTGRVSAAISKPDASQYPAYPDNQDPSQYPGYPDNLRSPPGASEIALKPETFIKFFRWSSSVLRRFSFERAQYMTVCQHFCCRRNAGSC